MIEALELTRTRARHWSGVFEKLAGVLEALQQGPERSLLGRSLGFLIERCLKGMNLPVGVGSGARFSSDSRSGEDMAYAVEFTQDGGGRGRESATDELECLVELARALIQEQAQNRFEDESLDSAALAEEFQAFQRDFQTNLSAIQLFPPAFCEAWQQLRESCEHEGQPIRRLGRELTIVRVIRSLYSLAIGYRDMGLDEAHIGSARSTWLALTIGEATLSGR